MKKSLAILLALLSVYIIWGSTYLGMRFAIESLPPLLMASVRYMSAGLLLFVFLRLRGAPAPTVRQWLHTGWVGILLLCGGNGLVCLALERGVGSGLAAMVLAVTPLFAVLIARYWGQITSTREWFGIALGLSGIIVLNLGGELRSDLLAGLLLIGAAVIWSLGSMWGKHLSLPRAFMASAVEMMIGGMALLLLSHVRGEHIAAVPTTQSLWALAYLILMGAVVGFSAYVYLLENVRPALATSYAYVNPVVAVMLGVWLGGEQMTLQEALAMGVVLAGVVLVCLPSARAMQASRTG